MAETKLDGESSPAMRQFHQFKQKYPDCIMFFRIGDFYEAFFEDAEICSKVLGLELISREVGSGESISLLGVPWHTFNSEFKKMLQAGYKVAICEQVEDPRTAKGPVKRDVIRIIAPTTERV